MKQQFKEICKKYHLQPKITHNEDVINYSVAGHESSLAMANARAVMTLSFAEGVATKALVEFTTKCLNKGDSND